VTAATHIPVKWQLAQGLLTSAQTQALGTDTFKILGVVAGGGIPSTTSSGIQFVGDVTGTNSEDTNIGARITLTSVAFAISGGVPSWSFADIVYAQAGGDDGLTRYFVIYDSSVGANDAAHPVTCIIDPGQLVSVVNGSLTIKSPSGGLITFTGGG
jgi:hypothetical protein